MSVSSADKYANLVATNDALTLSCGGYGTVGIQLAGTWTGTVTFEGTVDGGTWQTLNVTKTNASSQVTSATANGVWIGSVAGLLAVRSRFSTASSGTVEARMLIAGTGGGGGAGGGGGGGGAVTIADGDDVAEGATTDAAVTTDTTGTVSGKLRGLVKWSNERTPASLGQKAMAASFAVVVASDQSAIPVSGTVTATNDSVGTVGVAAPASATEVGFVDGAGDLAALAGDNLDYDTGAGSQAITVLGIALPGAGGPVAGGTATNPFRTDPTGTTTQPISAASLPLPTGAATAANQQTDALTDAELRATPVPISGTVTADAGTNLNTSLLALEAGGNLAAIAASTSVLDDWDETNRAAVNTIAGQVGVQGGSGASTALTQRVAIATDANTVAVSSKTIYTRPVYGTAQTVFNSSTDIAGGAFSAAGTDFTNNDGTIGAALYADAMIEMPDWAAAPVAGTTVQLWGLLINTDGTDDDTDAPSAAASGGARLLGSWVVAAADALQRRTITISLAGIQSGFTPYIFNGTAQNMNNDVGTNLVVKITPWTLAQVG